MERLHTTEKVSILKLVEALLCNAAKSALFDDLSFGKLQAMGVIKSLKCLYQAQTTNDIADGFREVRERFGAMEAHEKRILKLPHSIKSKHYVVMASEMNAVRFVLDGLRGHFAFLKLPAELRNMIYELHIALNGTSRRLSPYKASTYWKPNLAPMIALPALLLVDKQINSEISTIFIRNTHMMFMPEEFIRGSFASNSFIEQHLQQVTLTFSNFGRASRDIVLKLKDCKGLRTLNVVVLNDGRIGRDRYLVPDSFFAKHFGILEKPKNSLFYITGVPALMELRGLETVTVQYDRGHSSRKEVGAPLAKARAGLERVIRELLTAPLTVEPDTEDCIVVDLRSLKLPGQRRRRTV